MNVAKLIDAITFALEYGPELEEVLKEKKQARLNAEHKANAHRLKLCFDHRQEQNRSIYSEQNCAYCKLLKENQLLTTNEEETK